MSIRFSPKILNLRIHTSIVIFIKDFGDYLNFKKWPVDEPKHNQCVHNKYKEYKESGAPPCDYHWKSSDFEIKASEFHPDNSIKTIQYDLYIPGIRELETGNPVYSHTQSFKIEIPREYPARLDKIKIIAISQIFHPYVSTSRWGEIAIKFNGEINQVLFHLISIFLYDPVWMIENYQPSNKLTNFIKFNGRTINSNASSWYNQQNPNHFHQSLIEKWKIKRALPPKPVDPHPLQTRPGTLKILDDESL